MKDARKRIPPGIAEDLSVADWICLPADRPRAVLERADGQPITELDLDMQAVTVETAINSHPFIMRRKGGRMGAESVG